MKVSIVPIIIGVLETISKHVVQELKGVGNGKTNRDQPDYSVVKIGQNTAKNLPNLRILAVTQTAVKDHQQTSL